MASRVFLCQARTTSSLLAFYYNAVMSHPERARSALFRSLQLISCDGRGRFTVVSSVGSDRVDKRPIDNRANLLIINN
jgi:hypothetical protein